MPFIDDFGQDVRFGVRLLRKTPVLSGATILTLAIGIGLDAGVFNLIDGALFRPRVQHDPGTFVQVGVEYASLDGPRATGLPFVSLPDYEAYRSGARSFAELAAWSPVGVAVEAGPGTPAHHVALLVTCNFFRTYGPEQPLLGRAFRSDECATPDGAPVVVIGEDLWRAQYLSDPLIVGRTLLLNRHPFTVVGVMPTGYAGQLRGPVWVPHTMAARLFDGRDLMRDPATPWLVMIGRVASGVPREQAAAELTVMAGQLDRRVPGRRTTIRLTNGSLIDMPEMRGMAFWIVPLIMGSLSLVLLLACGNVTMLLLSRAAARRHEVAVRISLGAGRCQLLRMLVVESVLLASVAAAPAALLAYLLPRAVRASIPSMPVYPFHMDGVVVTYLAGVAVLAGVLAGIAPAIESLRQDVSNTLHGHDALLGSGRGSRTRDTLVAAQVAICLVLLVGAGVFVRAEYRLTDAALGYEADRVLLVAPHTGVASGGLESAATFYEDLAIRVRTIGGVRSVAFASAPPVLREETGSPAVAVRLLTSHLDPASTATRNVVSPEFFSTLSIPITRGRLFSSSEAGGRVPAAIVSESLARTLSSAPDPIGGLIETAPGHSAQIVGIAGDIRAVAGQASGEKVVYEVRQPRAAGDALLVRFDGESRAVASAIREAAASLNPDVLIEPQTLAALRDELATRFLRIVRMVLFLGVVAVMLAVIGIYAVVAFAVSRRTREMGIRSALGASRADIVRLVLTSSTRPVAVGVAIGVGLAALASQALTRVFQNAPVPLDSRDPLTYLSVTLLLALVAVAAMVRPAWRAARADPSDALRRD